MTQSKSRSIFPIELRFFFSFVVLFATLVSPKLVLGQEGESGASFLPDSTLAYLAIDQSNELIDQILEHPLREKIEQLEDVKKGLKDIKSPQAKAFIALFESQIGEQWLPALKSITANGIFVGFDGKTNAGILLIHAGDEAKLKRVLGTTLKWVRDTAKNQGGKAPFETHEYREARVAKFEKFMLARIGSWLLVSDNRELARAVADNMIDKNTSSVLAEDVEFKKARNESENSHQAWGFVNMALIGKSKEVEAVLNSKLEDAGAELFLGGLVAAVRSAPYATVGVDLTKDDLDAELRFPYDPNAIEEPRVFYFGENSSGVAPNPLIPENLIANVSTYRDIGAWWLAKEDLYEEQVIAGLAEADSNLSTVFGGVDFGQDVLSAIEPEIQIVVTRQSYDDSEPEIKIPAFAMVTRLKNPKEDSRRFKVAYQSVIGFANLALAQQGQPQLEMETHRNDDSVITSARYFSMQEESPEGLMIYNFSPAVSFVEGYMIISSTHELATELTEIALKGDSPSQKTDEHTVIELDAEQLSKTLADNRQALITQQILEKGNDAKAAEKEIQSLFNILTILDKVSLKVSAHDETIRARLNTTFK